MAKKLTQQELDKLRVWCATILVRLQKNQVPLGPVLQQMSKEAWDILKRPEDPALFVEPKKQNNGGIIKAPFGPGYL